MHILELPDWLAVEEQGTACCQQGVVTQATHVWMRALAAFCYDTGAASVRVNIWRPAYMSDEFNIHMHVNADMPANVGRGVLQQPSAASNKASLQC
jgi:hypothetical protein